MLIKAGSFYAESKNTQRPLVTGFPTSKLLSFQTKSFIIVELSGALVHCRMFSSIFGLYLLDANRTPPPPVMRPKTCLQISLGWGPWGQDTSPDWDQCSVETQCWQRNLTLMTNPTVCLESRHLFICSFIPHICLSTHCVICPWC